MPVLPAIPVLDAGPIRPMRETTRFGPNPLQTRILLKSRYSWRLSRSRVLQHRRIAMALSCHTLRRFALAKVVLAVFVSLTSNAGAAELPSADNSAVHAAEEPHPGSADELSEEPESKANQPIDQQSYTLPLGTTEVAYDEACQYYHWSVIPQGLIYRPYLASAKESRFRAVWNDERGEGDIWDVTLGGQVGILRYGTSGDTRPMGWQLGIEGAGLVRLDLDENSDVMASDYRFGVPLTWGNQFYQTKFGYYHLSSHVGDEFLLKNVGFPRLNFSRDVLVWGISLTPWELWRFYSEAGYAFYSDVSQQWEFQFGAEYAPNGATGTRGQPFAAFNGHLREEVDYGGNVAFQTGWAWRRSPASGMFRMGVEYYNGKSDQYSFFDESEQKVGFGLWYDY